MNYDTLHHVYCSMYDMNESEESVFSLQAFFLGVNGKCCRPSPPDPQQKHTKTILWPAGWSLMASGLVFGNQPFMLPVQVRKVKKCEWPGSERYQDVSCGDFSGILTRRFTS